MAASGALLAVVAAAQRRAEQVAAQEASVAVWESFARRAGLAFEVRDGAGAPAPRLVGEIAGVASAFEIAMDAQTLPHTRVLADAVVASDAVVTVHPGAHGVFDALKSALFGAKKAPVDAAFDASFFVHAAPSDAADSLLDETMRDALKLWLGHGFEAFTYERGRIALMWRGVELDPAVLDAAWNLVARAARWRMRGAGDGGYRDAG